MHACVDIAAVRSVAVPVLADHLHYAPAHAHPSPAAPSHAHARLDASPLLDKIQASLAVVGQADASVLHERASTPSVRQMLRLYEGLALVDSVWIDAQAAAAWVNPRRAHSSGPKRQTLAGATARGGGGERDADGSRYLAATVGGPGDAGAVAGCSRSGPGCGGDGGDVAHAGHGVHGAAPIPSPARCAQLARLLGPGTGCARGCHQWRVQRVCARSCREHVRDVAGLQRRHVSLAHDPGAL